jgi:hypothetical protein
MLLDDAADGDARCIAHAGARRRIYVARRTEAPAALCAGSLLRVRRAAASSCLSWQLVAMLSQLLILAHTEAVRDGARCW